MPASIDSGLRFRAGLLAIVLLLLAGCATPSAKAPAEPAPEHWQALAKADLDAIHQLILDAHPGARDELNPGFMEWTETGYHEALALLPRVFNYDSMLAAVRYYTTGFRDDHLLYSDDIRAEDALIPHAGWAVEYTGNRYIVTAIADAWPVALPPVGSILLQCDGRAVDSILRDDVAPFVDRRELPRTPTRWAYRLSVLSLRGGELKRCQFSAPDGATLDLDVVYHGITSDQYWDWFVAAPEKPMPDRSNDYQLQDGILWIRASNFSLNPEQVIALDAMLDALPKLAGVRAIVFDARLNGGGDSSVGDRIFEAATGGLSYDTTGVEQLPQTYAQWRVSDVAIGEAEERVAQRRAQYGADSEQLRDSEDHLKALQDARQKGEIWVRQVEGPRLDRAEIRRRGGHLKRFDGPIALLTRSNCASSCLDFADLVLSVPGAVHLGQETSSDTLYIDVAFVTLPSGNGFMMPLKVWRNRLRGNNETLKPDVPLDFDAMDEATVRARVIKILSLPAESD